MVNIMKKIRNLSIVWIANKEFVMYICKNHKLVFLLQIVAMLFSSFSASLVSQTSKLFIESVLEYQNLKLAMGHVIFLVSYTLLMNGVQLFSNVYSNYAYSKAQIVVKKNLFSRISNIKLSYYDIPENKNILSRAINYMDNSGPQLFNYFFSLITSLLSIFSLLYLLSSFSAWVVVFLIALTLYKAFFESYIANKKYVFKKEKTLLNREIGYYNRVLTSPQNLVNLNIYNAFSFFFEKYRFSQTNSLVQTRNHNIQLNIVQLISLLSNVLQNIVLYLYVGVALLNQKITVADFTLFFTAVNYFNAILSSFRKNISNFTPMLLESQNYNEFINKSNEYKYADKEVMGNQIDIKKIENIEFKNVFFKYPSKAEYVLQNVSFSISAGEIVSIAGSNGAGKSSLLKLMLGLYDPTEGQIYVNSIPLKKINLLSYWQCCGVIFQNANVYSISAYENIVLKNTKEENVDNVLEYVNLKERFLKEEEGIHTQLSRDFNANGTMLSGGECQKILLARTLYHKRDCLIFDEPTSAIDAQSERNVFALINKIHDQNKNSLIVFISHHMSNSRQADKILFVNNGAIDQMGNHHFMINNCKEYADLYYAQTENH